MSGTRRGSPSAALLAAAVAAFTAACGYGETPTSGQEERRSAVDVERPEAPAARPATPGPVETIRAFSEAVRRKDAAAVKGMLTNGSLAMLEGGAAAKNMSLDEFIVKGGDMPFEEIPEIGAERIEGDTATVEVRYRGESDRVVLERVDGVWKLAFDKG